MIALRPFIELNFFPFLVGRRISPSRAVNEQIFRQSLDSDNPFFVLDIEGIEVTPKVLFLEPLFDSADDVAELVFAEIAF